MAIHIKRRIAELLLLPTQSKNHLGKWIFKNLWVKFCVFCGVLFVLIPTSPINMPYSGRDSGVFLYAGWRILRGDIPYVQIWDHKPPLIFYINAIGLVISNNSRWGVWAIEFISLFLATLIGFNLMKRAFGNLAAVFGTFLWLSSLIFIIQGGNLTTEYTLPIQFACFWISSSAKEKGFNNWRGYLLGMLCGIAFFLKQNAIGMGIAIVIYIFIQQIVLKQPKTIYKNILPILIGWVFVASIITTTLLIQGAFKAFIDASFGYSLNYSEAVGILQRVKNLFVGINLLSRTGLAQFGIVGFCFALAIALHPKHAIKINPLLVIAVIDLPIEIVFANVTGMVFPHYFITYLPSLALLSAFSFSQLVKIMRLVKVPKFASVGSLLLILMMFSMYMAPDYAATIVKFRSYGDQSAIEYVKQHTTPDEYVLVWGAETQVNFFTQRRNPSRFNYLYPLYQKGFVTEQMILEFLGDINTYHPLIIDSQNSATPLYNFPISSDKINAAIRDLQVHYIKIGSTSNGWPVYQYSITAQHLRDPRESFRIAKGRRIKK
jgi:4-amino-4-deoxy-L-arabinose transferase-like glycosyltransferase